MSENASSKVHSKYHLRKSYTLERNSLKLLTAKRDTDTEAVFLLNRYDDKAVSTVSQSGLEQGRLVSRNISGDHRDPFHQIFPQILTSYRTQRYFHDKTQSNNRSPTKSSLSSFHAFHRLCIDM